MTWRSLPSWTWTRRCRWTAEDLLGARLVEGWISSRDHGWLSEWLAALGTHIDGQKETVIHGDIQAANVLVDDLADYLALIDWGDARLDDPANDFAGVPMGVVPAMLEGYGGEPTLGFKARVVHRHLQVALLLMPRGALSDLSWAERPAPILLELMRFFASGPPPRWSESNASGTTMRAYPVHDRQNSFRSARPDGYGRPVADNSYRCLHLTASV